MGILSLLKLEIQNILEKVFPKYFNFIMRADLNCLLDNGVTKRKKEDTDEERDVEVFRKSKGDREPDEKVSIESDDDYFGLSIVFFLSHAILWGGIQSLKFQKCISIVYVMERTIN